MATKLLDQIQAQIYRGIDATAAEQPPVFGDELFGLPANLRIAFAKYFGDAPMGSCSPAIENSAFGKECDSGACAGNVGPARMPLLQPRQERRIFCNMVQHIPTGRGHDDDVGLIDIAY
jgi:hypothetical protein